MKKWRLVLGLVSLAIVPMGTVIALSVNPSQNVSKRVLVNNASQSLHEASTMYLFEDIIQDAANEAQRTIEEQLKRLEGNKQFPISRSQEFAARLKEKYAQLDQIKDAFWWNPNYGLMNVGLVKKQVYSIIEEIDKFI